MQLYLRRMAARVDPPVAGHSLRMAAAEIDALEARVAKLELGREMDIGEAARVLRSHGLDVHPRQKAKLRDLCAGDA